MVTTSHLIEQLSKFPQGAKVEIVDDWLVIHKPSDDSLEAGAVHCPHRHKKRARATRMGGWKGWMDRVFYTAGGRIQRALLEDPHAARSIAFAAIAGLYLEEDEDTALPEHQSYPRGSGSAYVDCVGEAIQAAELFPLIQELQAEVDDE